MVQLSQKDMKKEIQGKTQRCSRPALVGTVTASVVWILEGERDFNQSLMTTFSEAVVNLSILISLSQCASSHLVLQ